MTKYIFLALIFISTHAFSQSDKQIINIGGQVLVKGKITDAMTGVPIGTNLEFKSQAGKKIKTQSNTLTGNWETLLPEGLFDVIIQSWDVARQLDTVEINPGKKYKEIEKNFIVRRMLPKDIFLKTSFFTQKSETPNPLVMAEIENLKEVMKFNRGVEFIFYINAQDMIPPKEQQKEEPLISTPKSKKKPKKSFEKPKQQELPKESYNLLIDNRVNQLKATIESWGSFAKRIKIEPDYANSKSQYPENLIIIVEKNEDIFNK